MINYDDNKQVVAIAVLLFCLWLVLMLSEIGVIK